MPISYIGRADLPLGLRNNNPGNLRAFESWQGQIGVDDKDFLIFKDVSWGLRALGTDLTNKVKRGLNTVELIISEYAPATDNNDVPKYINAVSYDTGLDPDQTFALDREILHKLIRAIINHENGETASQLITDQDIEDGIDMMNSPLLTYIQSIPIAVQNAVTSPVGWVWVVIGGGLLYFLTRKKQ